MLDESGHFTKKGSRKFLDSVAGYISYLSREKDARQFSQPIITSVNVPLSRSSIDYKKAADIEAQFVDKISEVSSEISEINQWMNEKKKEIAARKRDVKNECKGLKKEKRAECLEKIKKQIDELNDELFKQKMIADDGKEDVKAKLKELRKQKKTLMDREMTDYSQEGILRNKCIKKNKDDDDDERNSRRGDKVNSRD
jgi:hypothetical protein